MIVFGIGISLLLMSILLYVYLNNVNERYNKEKEYKGVEVPVPSKYISFIPLLISIVMIFCSCIYSQDVGETAVLRNLGGSLAGSSTEAGFHFKAPWQDVISYDVRNNLVNYHGENTEYSYDGGSAEGPYVTINDKSGAKADVDIQVNYSLDSDTARYLYSEYGTQENFTKNYVSNDLRSVTREAAGEFDTISLLTKRGDFTNSVQEALTKKWNKIGLTVEQVSVQDISYPKSITDAYADAQAAEIEKSKAQNKQETAKVEAETKKIQAEGEAQANRTLNDSLTDNVLKQKYIDALEEAAKNDNLIITDGSSGSLITVQK